MILIASFYSSFLTVVNFVIANPSNGEFFVESVSILAVYIQTFLSPVTVKCMWGKTPSQRFHMERM